MSAPGPVRIAEHTRTDWQTPDPLFKKLDYWFGFTIDGAASAENAKCERFYSVEDDAFKQSPMNEVIWCNPPYGRELPTWIELFDRWRARNVVVALLPAATDTEWFADAARTAEDVMLMTGRVQFVGTTSSNPSGSAVFVWGVRPFGQKLRMWDWRKK